MHSVYTSEIFLKFKKEKRLLDHTRGLPATMPPSRSLALRLVTEALLPPEFLCKRWLRSWLIDCSKSPFNWGRWWRVTLLKKPLSTTDTSDSGSWNIWLARKKNMAIWGILKWVTLWNRKTNKRKYLENKCYGLAYNGNYYYFILSPYCQKGDIHLI